MESTWNFIPEINDRFKSEPICTLARDLQNMKMKSTGNCRLPEFRKITPENMGEVWRYLQQEPGRTTDFSYGGILMWVDMFKYEYAIYRDTLFIKGVVENDIDRPAFSLPVGALPLKESVALVKEYCAAHGIRAEFSGVPQYALDEMTNLNPRIVEELTDWGDYLYDAEMLATVAGKKMSKKRNHVHKFESTYPDAHTEWLTPENATLALQFMDEFDKDADDCGMATEERMLTRRFINLIIDGDTTPEGMLLLADGKVCAFTIGDVKNDTLFIHVEKAFRDVAGSYEMINYLFAKGMKEKYPEIRFINREDDAGDIGLRMAKQSYHPIEILKKYNVSF